MKRAPDQANTVNEDCPSSEEIAQMRAKRYARYAEAAKKLVQLDGHRDMTVYEWNGC